MFAPFPARRRGFTLIELLVVIAIIAVLAAILFPVFAQAREAGRKASCASNLKQIGMAILQYTQDFDERYPMAFYGFSASGTSLSWSEIIQPYIKNAAVLRCPSLAQSTGVPPGMSFPVGYAYNYYVGGNNNPNGGVLNRSLPEVGRPADTILAGDSGTLPRQGVDPLLWTLKLHSTRRYTAWLYIHAGSTLVNTNDYGAPHARHQEHVNLLWADGHVKARKIPQFYTLPGNEVTNPGPPAGATRNWSPCLDPAFGCR